ncbi:TIGR03435 family protein [Terriglobus sp. TAA 43]|uniref:TIGR03435 family protein n=1 Tax=Terriglobus sp. TAA 43 TaxID=278961 RepID=UPI00068F6B44|nr:TIGR03435 family protein [Terriglobus sp. TAA 43]
MKNRFLAKSVLLLCAFSCVKAQSPSVEVATIKPSDPEAKDEWFTVRGRHYMTTNTSVSDLLRYAFGLSQKQVEGAPDWTSRERFDLDALTAREGAIGDEQMREMTREILVQRFHLRFHDEIKEMDVYALTVAKGGIKIAKTTRSPQDNTDFYGPRGELIVKNATLTAVASGLSRGMVPRPVVDQTGLTGKYDFDLRWIPEDSQPDGNSALPGFYRAFEEQLGLKLTAARAPMTVMVVDEISRPTAN